MVEGENVTHLLNKYGFDLACDRRNEEYRIFIRAVHNKQGHGLEIVAFRKRNRKARGKGKRVHSFKKVMVTILDGRGHPIQGVEKLVTTNLTEIESVVKKVAGGHFKHLAAA